MNQVLTTTAVSKKIRKIFFISGCLIFTVIPAMMFAQADSVKQKTDTTTKAGQPAAAEEVTLISPSVEFASVQKSDNTIDLKAGLKAKVKGTFYKLPLLKITFKQVTETAEKELGFIITDREGKAVFNVKADSLVTDKEGKLHFKAVFAGNKSMDAAEEELTIKRARLVITPVKDDSLLSVSAKLVDLGTGAEKPVPEAVLGIFVKRLFSSLKIGEGTTDENGEATVEIPSNLPGDAKGNITLTGRLDDNELYGNLEATVVQPWGIAVSDRIEDQPRALWSSHPPMWMLLTFIVLMSVVWGHYIVILVQLIRLRKEEPKTA